MCNKLVHNNNTISQQVWQKMASHAQQSMAHIHRSSTTMSMQSIQFSKSRVRDGGDEGAGALEFAHYVSRQIKAEIERLSLRHKLVAYD